MHDDRELVEERITRELTERVLPLVHPQRRALDVEAGPTLDRLAPFAVGQRWGLPWSTTWFRFAGELPASWSGRRVEALLDLGFRADSPGFQCEGLVRDAKGRPVQGVHPRRQAVPVTSGPGPVELVVEAAANPMFPQFRPSPLGSPNTAGTDLLYRLERAELVVVDASAEDLLHDLDVLDGTMRALSLDDPRRARIRVAITRALDVLASPPGGCGDPAVAARAAVADVLAVPARAGAHRVVATGHAHIDTAWLWPLGETVRKCTRTFASAVALMDDAPDFRFSCSQAQQYAWIAEREPELFARITDHVAGGQWIPVGGMWVEPDMNLPSGESIVRQIVFGQRFFEQRFGVRCREVWIPDVFGYPAGLPQVFAAGGMDRFVTQKLSWNRQNRFPHSTFWWEGIDGTRVLTHFPPVDTYNAEVLPAEMAHSVRRFAEHAWSGWSLMPFGYGDGGGGPTREMLQRLRRMSDLDGMPPIEQGSPGDFFDHVDDEIRRGAPVPVWRGELYFETHRGTLTSQLRTKLGNRRCERLLREAELWTATSGGGPGGFDDLWREVLTLQFHDIIPGSSIAWVHDEAEAAHRRIADELERRVDDVLAELAPSGVVLANSATVSRDEVVVADAEPDGPVQRLSDGRVAFRAAVPGLAVSPAIALAAAERVVVTDRSMSNGRLAVSWDLDGNLRSVIDVARARELLPAGELGAVLELAPDRPVRYDAWDLESWVRDDPARLTTADLVEVVEHGPLLGSVRVQRSFGESAATLLYVLRAGSSRLDVHVELDWHHQEHLLSLAFPLDVRADEATCGIQFGAVRRPTHPSSSWDAAKFEVCAHRYVDVAEPSFGVAVLNDGRYGHHLFGGAVRVSLARGARYPDPDADQGRHEVTFSLFPHGPGLADLVAEAERLAMPVRVVAGGRAATAPPPVVSVAGAGVEVDAVKAADDGSGDLIVRFHEACGDRARITVAADRRIVAASRCNLLEEPDGSFEVSDGIVAMTLRPFQLVTLRLTRD
jgi:alpha-mannosidase